MNEIERITKEWATTALFYVGLSYGRNKTQLPPLSEIGQDLIFRWFIGYGRLRAAIEQKKGSDYWLSDYKIGGYDPFLFIVSGQLELDKIKIVEAIIEKTFPGIEVWKCGGCQARFNLERISDDLLCDNCSKILQPRNNDKSGFVYIFGSSETGYYKIGCSSRPNNRLLDYQQTKLPFPIQMIHTFPADNQYIAESILHNLLGQQRSNGEWFRLSEDELHKIVSIKGYHSGNLIT